MLCLLLRCLISQFGRLLFRLVTVIYLSLRVDKEGLNLDVLSRDLGVETDRLPVPTTNEEESAEYHDLV